MPTKPPADKVNATSVHEAGHAVVTLALRRGIGAISIRPDGHIGGFSKIVCRRSSVRLYGELPDGSFVRVGDARGRAVERKRARDLMTVFLAGREAERQILPDLMSVESDKVDREMIAEQLPAALRPGQTANDLLSELEGRTAALVRKHRALIIEIAAYLVANETLSPDEARSLWRSARASPAPK